MPKSALITGVSGQDGSFLAEFLLDQGYSVHGMLRPSSERNLEYLEAIRNRLVLHPADLSDQASLVKLLAEIQPTEVYNLAAQSFVPLSWQKPELTADITGLGVTRLLEAVRLVDPGIRFFQAGSSEMFGAVQETPQRETTPFHPRNPYGAAKVYAHHMTANYREHHGIFACSGILYNHESPRRGPEFVTAKITGTAARIKLGQATELRLGNLSARRDWGFAGDFVRGMWLMLQQDVPDDYVIGTGELHSVEEFVQAAFARLDLDWRESVVVDPQFYRPAEPDLLVADPTRAKERLGWAPQVCFEDLVAQMVDAHLARLQQPSRQAA